MSLAYAPFGSKLWPKSLRFTDVVLIALSACSFVFLSSCKTQGMTQGMSHAQRILFVGNSVIYTNNLPAIFDRIAEAQPGAPKNRIDMFARGGATLSEFNKDERLRDMIESGDYDVVILQERSGDDLCVTSPEGRADVECQELITAHVGLAKLARKNGANVLYLGTYQFAPQVSSRLVDAERWLSKQMGAEYIEISEILYFLRQSQPEFPWLYADNGHPGIATTMLMGVRIYTALTGGNPAPFELCVSANLYTPKSKIDGMVAFTDLIAPVGPKQCPLSEVQVKRIVQGAKPTTQNNAQ